MSEGGAAPASTREPVLHVFSRYFVCGSIAAATQFLVLALLVEIGRVIPTLASAIGFTIGMLVNYTLQYNWTFKSDGAHAVVFTRFLTVTLSTLVVNTGIFWVLNEPLGIPYILAQVITTGMVMILNFLLNRHYTFAARSS